MTLLSHPTVHERTASYCTSAVDVLNHDGRW